MQRKRFASEDDIMLTSRPASAMAAAWMSELNELKSRNKNEPLHPAAWQWRVRSKILSYLFSRYGSDPNLGLRSQDEASRLMLANRIVAERHSNQVRTGTFIRKVLSRVAEANKYCDKWSGINKMLAK